MNHPFRPGVAAQVTSHPFTGGQPAGDIGDASDDSADATPQRHHRHEIRDRSALDALGRAIASPVIDSARAEDPFLPEPGAHDQPPKARP